MAHNLNFNNGKASFFTVKEKAWHGLGKVVDTAPTSKEAIKLAGLDYQVVKQPIYLEDGTPIPDAFSTVRMDTNTPLGVVGGRYEVLQNTEAFEFFDAIVGEDQAIFETAGALGKGETIFITAKLPDYIRVGNGDDVIEQYLFLTNNHNGKGAIQAAFTPVRIVCNNTLNAALRHKTNCIRIMHHGDVAGKVKAAHNLMGIVNLLKNELEGVFNQMAKTRIVDNQLREIILKSFATPANMECLASKDDLTAGQQASLTRLEGIVSDAYAYAMTSDSQQLETTKGTLFGAYNAVTGYIQNVKEYGNAESQLTSILNGSGFDYTQKAFNLCKALL